MTEKQLQVSNNLRGLLHHRLTEQQLNEELSRFFGREIKVEKGLDEEWDGDDYFTFCVDDEEIGGYFDIYYLPMPRKPEYFYLTEVNEYFEHVVW